MFATVFGALAALTLGELPEVKAVKIEKLFEVPHYCEGIVFDKAGNGFISHGEVITTFTPDGKHRTWTTTSVPGPDGTKIKGAPNGHKVLADGTHLVCDAGHHAVLRLDPQGKIIGKASAECAGKPLRGPNDLSLDPQGGFYFTDPGGSDDKKLIGTIHYVDSQGTTHLVAQGLAFPNGIVLTPDRKKLLVAESKKNRILLYEVQAPGKVGPLQVFCELPNKEGEQIDNQPDGICLDTEGNLYVAHYGMRQVQVINPKGEIIRRYPGGNMTTSNVGFGGPNSNMLYITGGLGEEAGPGGLFRIELAGVKGVPLLAQRGVQEKKPDTQLEKKVPADPTTFNNAIAKVTKDLENMGRGFGEILANEKDAKKMIQAHQELIEKFNALVADTKKIQIHDSPAGKAYWKAFQKYLGNQEKIVKDDFKDLIKVMVAPDRDQIQLLRIFERIQMVENADLNGLRQSQSDFSKATGLKLK